MSLFSQVRRAASATKWYGKPPSSLFDPDYYLSSTIDKPSHLNESEGENMSHAFSANEKGESSIIIKEYQ